MHPALNIAIKAIRIAGDFMAKKFETFNYINCPINAHNYYLNIEQKIEYLIINTIKKYYPLHNFVTKHNHKITNKTTQWIIDPLSNSTNFIKNFPHVAISIALQTQGITEIAITYDPIRNELFSATRGKGAQLNNYRLHGNSIKNLHNSILSIYIPNIIKCYNMIDIINKLHAKCKNIRYTGSIALDLVYLAVGRTDGLIAIGLKPYNMIGGILIIKESGKFISDFSGNSNYLISGNIIASNSKIIKEILILTHNS